MGVVNIVVILIGIYLITTVAFNYKVILGQRSYLNTTYEFWFIIVIPLIWMFAGNLTSASGERFMIVDIGFGLFILYHVIGVVTGGGEEAFLKMYNISSENEESIIEIIHDTIIKFGLSAHNIKLQRNKIGYQIIFKKTPRCVRNVCMTQINQYIKIHGTKGILPFIFLVTETIINIFILRLYGVGGSRFSRIIVFILMVLEKAPVGSSYEVSGGVLEEAQSPFYPPQ